MLVYAQVSLCYENWHHVRALLIALLGIVHPLLGAVSVICGAAVIEGTFSPPGATLRASFASGAALAPTSLGVTAALLSEHAELDSALGKLVSIAAVFDDVIGLVLLAEVQAAAITPIRAWSLIRPALFSLVLLAL